MVRYLLVVFFVCASSFAYSTPAWYRGVIDRVWTFGADGDFVITYVNDTNISDCQHTYIYFRAADMSSTLIQNAYAMALASFHTGSDVGVVIDKNLNGAACHAMSIDIRKG